MSKQIFKDGVHDISNEQYHAADGISRSKLMLLDKSPYHFWYEMYSGKAEVKESTPAMNVGGAFHTLLVEPHLFTKEFAVAPKVDRRTAKGKEEFNAFMEANSGKILLTNDQYAKASVMAEHVKQHEIVTTLLDEARFEQSIFWTDIETGIQFKTRPDIWSAKMVVDLKTTADANGVIDLGSYFNFGATQFTIIQSCKIDTIDSFSLSSRSAANGGYEFLIGGSSTYGNVQLRWYDSGALMLSPIILPAVPAP